MKQSFQLEDGFHTRNRSTVGIAAEGTAQDILFYGICVRLETARRAAIPTLFVRRKDVCSYSEDCEHFPQREDDGRAPTTNLSSIEIWLVFEFSNRRQYYGWKHPGMPASNITKIGIGSPMRAIPSRLANDESIHNESLGCGFNNR